MQQELAAGLAVLLPTVSFLSLYLLRLWEGEEGKISCILFSCSFWYGVFIRCVLCIAFYMLVFSLEQSKSLLAAV